MCILVYSTCVYLLQNKRNQYTMSSGWVIIMWYFTGRVGHAGMWHLISPTCCCLLYNIFSVWVAFHIFILKCMTFCSDYVKYKLIYLRLMWLHKRVSSALFHYLFLLSLYKQTETHTIGLWLHPVTQHPADKSLHFLEKNRSLFVELLSCVSVSCSDQLSD